jgi:hypothetical protein
MVSRLALLIFLLVPSALYSQTKPVSPPPEGAAPVEQQRWLVNAIRKYGTFKSLGTSISISSPKLDACVLSFVQTKRYGSMSHDTMGAKERVDSVKGEVRLDLAKLDIASLKVEDHFDPELSIVSLRIGPSDASSKNIEIIVQQPAAGAVKTTLERVVRSCIPAN